MVLLSRASLAQVLVVQAGKTKYGRGAEMLVSIALRHGVCDVDGEVPLKLLVKTSTRDKFDFAVSISSRGGHGEGTKCRGQHGMCRFDRGDTFRSLMKRRGNISITRNTLRGAMNAQQA